MKITREKDKNLGSWVWKADFTHKGIRCRPKAFSKSDLEEIVTQLKSNADRKAIGLGSRAPKITLGQLFDAHVRELDLTRKYHRWARKVLAHFVDKTGENTAVEDLTISDISAFVRLIKDERLAKFRKGEAAQELQPESINKQVSFISVMLKGSPRYFKSLTNYQPPKMPWAAVSKKPKQRVISKEESETLLRHLRFNGLHENEKPTSRTARFEYADLFEVAMHTAMRWGEIVRLEWTMVDLRNKEISLPQEITKTREPRTVYLNSRALEIVEERKKKAVSKYVFPGDTPDTHRKYYYEGIRRAAKALGLPFGRDIGFTLHTTRHTAVSELLRKTGDFAGVQLISGHSSAVMTARYAHAHPKRLLGLVENLVEKSEK